MLPYCRDTAWIRLDLQSKMVFGACKKPNCSQTIHKHKKKIEAGCCAVLYKCPRQTSCRGTNRRRNIWNVASKLPLLLSAFSFLSVIKHWVHAPFYSYTNACFVHCPLFVWMYVASQESQGSFWMHLDQCHSSSVLYTESSILFIYSEDENPWIKNMWVGDVS